MKKQILKLGTIVTDNITDMKGMLTIYETDMVGNEMYLFQPQALNPDTGQPVNVFIINSARIVGGELIDVELPIEVLGTEVEDLATKFKGVAVEMNYHINGCVHFNVKAKGRTKKGSSIDAVNFDVRRLKGSAIKTLSAKALEQSKKNTPSPSNGGFSRQV